MMTDTFLAPGGTHPTPTNKASSSLTAAKGGPATISRDEREAKSSSHMTVFDTFSYGFDLPAGVQLNRINKKLHFWEKTQGHIEERAAQRELWAKNILKKEHQKEAKIQQAFGRTARTRREHWEKRNEARYTKKAAIETEQRHQAQEVWTGVKKYYREVEQFDLDKKAREKAIADRLAAYYNAASGAKADEDRKRIEAAAKAIEDGQTLNRELLEKLDERGQKVVGMKLKKGLEVKELNDVADQVKYKVYENIEQKSYNALHKNVKKGETAEKAAKANAKELRQHVQKKRDENLSKYYQAINHKKEEQSELKEKRGDLEEKEKQREDQVARQKRVTNQQKMQVAEKHRMNEQDVNENQ